VKDLRHRSCDRERRRGSSTEKVDGKSASGRANLFELTLFDPAARPYFVKNFTCRQIRGRSSDAARGGGFADTGGMAVELASPRQRNPPVRREIAPS
jgi:hypothetical protein